MAETANALEWKGREVIGSDGERIGTLDAVYLDRQTDRPEWATVDTGLFGGKSSFVPLVGARPSGGDVHVQVTKDQVQHAPGVDADGLLSEEEEIELFRHYGVDYSEEGSVTATAAPQAAPTGRRAVGHDTSGPTTDDAMTRSEEELRVGKAQRERGRVRLRKYVVTEHVQQTVPVRREELRIEREPITEANAAAATDGPPISDEEHEIVLHEEEVVTQRRVVPKERVRLEKETVVDEQTVSEELRKERIEADTGDAGR